MRSSSGSRIEGDERRRGSSRSALQRSMSAGLSLDSTTAERAPCRETTYRFVLDHLGSPRTIVDATTGEVVQEMDFDEYGKVTRDTQPGLQPFGFGGGLYDLDTKLVRFGARDYDGAVIH